MVTLQLIAKRPSLSSPSPAGMKFEVLRIVVFSPQEILPNYRRETRIVLQLDLGSL